MPDRTHLLTLPVEVRWHIYSFMYIEDRIVNFLHPKSLFIKTALSLSCQQLYQETLNYYYGQNTFSLPLRQRFAMSDWHFLPRHFNLIKVLRLEANTFFWKSSRNSLKTSDHTKNCQRRMEKYLTALFWVDQGSLAPNLKTLIFAEKTPTEHDKWYWDQDIDTSRERLKGYVQVFERLKIGVGQVVVEIESNRITFRGMDDESEVIDWSLDLRAIQKQ